MNRALPAHRYRLVALVLAVVVGLGVMLYAKGIWFPVARAGQPMALIVHAGDMTAGPENSLPAILGAVANGADGIEVDVAQSTDGTWWLMHSGDEISDTTTGSGRFTGLSDAEISELRINGGVGYRPELGLLPIPRLTEVLAAVRDWEGILQLDNTMLTEASAEDLARVFSAAPFAGEKVIISRFPEASAVIKQVDPTIRTLLIANPDPPADDPALDAWLTEESSLARPDVIALRPYDVEVYTYFEKHSQDEASAIERAWRWGATAYLTWDLPRARQLVDALVTPGR